MKISDDRILRIIAVFKFFKAAMLIALGIGAFRLLHRDLGQLAERLVEALRLDPGGHFVTIGLAKVSKLHPDQIRKLGLVSFLYAALFLTEGTGLWQRKLWGEWLTVIITGSFVPLEIYEIFRHPNWVKVAVLVINLGIIAYLIYRVRERRAT